MGRVILNVWTEARFARTPDGAVWTPAIYDHRFWTRYLTAFDEVRAVARVLDVEEVPASSSRVDGKSVGVVGLPYYEGSVQLAGKYRLTRLKSLRVAARLEGAALFRVPSIVAGPPIAAMRRRNQPYGLEVVGDPRDVFAKGASTHPLRIPIRLRMTRTLQEQCANATAVAYVTAERLQRRYPAGPEAIVASYSSVELPPAAFVHTHRSYFAPIAPTVEVVTIAAMDQPYKGVDTLIESIGMCADAGFRCRLSIVGDGRLRPELEKHAARRTPPGSVAFLGTVPQGRSLWSVLDASDIFVLASRTEGLPRSLIEAMARGMPALGTRVGGIPELLEPPDLIAPNDPHSLATAIRSLSSDLQRLGDSSERNLLRAREYASAVLEARRNTLYEGLRIATELHR